MQIGVTFLPSDERERWWQLSVLKESMCTFPRQTIVNEAAITKRAERIQSLGRPFDGRHPCLSKVDLVAAMHKSAVRFQIESHHCRQFAPDVSSLGWRDFQWECSIQRTAELKSHKRASTCTCRTADNSSSSMSQFTRMRAARGVCYIDCDQNSLPLRSWNDDEIFRQN